MRKKSGCGSRSKVDQIQIKCRSNVDQMEIKWRSNGDQKQIKFRSKESLDKVTANLTLFKKLFKKIGKNTILQQLLDRNFENFEKFENFDRHYFANIIFEIFFKFQLEIAPN